MPCCLLPVLCCSDLANRVSLYRIVMAMITANSVQVTHIRPTEVNFHQPENQFPSPESQSDRISL